MDVKAIWHQGIRSVLDLGEWSIEYLVKHAMGKGPIWHLVPEPLLQIILNELVKVFPSRHELLQEYFRNVPMEHSKSDSLGRSRDVYMKRPVLFLEYS